MSVMDLLHLLLCGPIHLSLTPVELLQSNTFLDSNHTCLHHCMWYVGLVILLLKACRLFSLRVSPLEIYLIKGPQFQIQLCHLSSLAWKRARVDQCHIAVSCARKVQQLHTPQISDSTFHISAIYIFSFKNYLENVSTMFLSFSLHSLAPLPILKLQTQ